jgi:TorA maturation chaperone TorD
MRTAENHSATEDNLAEEEGLRMNTYSLLARLLHATPDAALLGCLGQIAAVPAAANPLERSWQRLKIAAELAQALGLGELDDEFHVLFIGVGRGEVMPYGSWYQTGYLMDRPLARLRGDLRRLGIERQADVREPEDHAAALCESMALLIQSATPVALQQQFYEAHLGSWLQRFFLDLDTAPSARFYKAVGQLGAAFMSLERRYLST